jgi:hypothetical protein
MMLLLSGQRSIRGQLRDGKIAPEQFEMVRKKLDGDVKKTNWMQERGTRSPVQLLDRYWPPPKRCRSKK